MAQTFVVVDFETRSEADLRAVGGYEYSTHPTTEAMCVAWRVGTKETLRTAPTHVWSPFKASFPEGYEHLAKALTNPEHMLVAHNAFFEQVITRNVLTRYEPFKTSFPSLLSIPHERWICTAARAAALALPRNLEGAAFSLGLPIQKDMEGRRLLLKMCKPRKATKKNDAKWHETEEDIDRLIEYCKTDIGAEVELFLATPPLNETERKVWALDQKINFRGVNVDRQLVAQSLVMIDAEIENMVCELSALTFGQVEKVSQRDRMLRYFHSIGVRLPDLQAGTIKAAIDSGEYEGKALRLLEIKRDFGKSSVAKYDAFWQRSRTDGRVRDSLLYHGASTGRWSGSGVQFQNLPRGSVKDTDLSCALVKDGDLETIKMMYGNAMDVFSSNLRGCVIASPGKELFCADYAAIEARVLFWVAGHDEGCRMFADGIDLYKDMAAEIYNVAFENVAPKQRQLGKAAILGCLAVGTRVLTQNGLKSIENISRNDKLWDGVEWVNHDGVLAQGTKNVIKIESRNIFATPEHRFLSNRMWQSAVEIVLSEGTPAPVCSHLSVSSLSFQQNIGLEPNAVSLCAAYAELKRVLESTNSLSENLKVVLDANNLWSGGRAETPTELATLLVTRVLENVGTRVTTTLKNGARTPLIKTLNGMEVAALDAPSSPLEHFWNTLLILTGLKQPGLHSIELITTGVMSLETYESLAKMLTIKTVETFDILNAGPRFRYQAENSIVHNCGYGMGAVKFAETVKAQGITLEGELVKVMTPTGIKHVPELAVTIVNTYREAHAQVPSLWKKLESAAKFAIRNPGKVAKICRTKWFLKNDFLWCELPSGRRLAYYKPKIEIFTEKKKGELWKKEVILHYGVNGTTKQWELQKTWGGTLTENVVQAIARDFMADAMLRIEDAGYEITLSIHDELVAERKVGEGNLKEYEALMSTVPEWGIGCPIKVEGWSAKRYRK